jgi:murein peptide amidase A
VLRSLIALLAVVASLAAGPRPHARRAQSVSLGRPDHGSLVRGVRFPAEGRLFFTWDPLLRRSPDRPWRRYGNDRLVRIVLHVVREYAAAHPGAPRVGIGDFSLPHGGPFGPKHASHQNGLDVDVYYPRLDRRERPPDRPAQIDRRLSQDLLNRFVRARAVRIFVGPNTHLTGPRRVVQVLALHDNHMHVRIAKPARGLTIGRSVRGRRIVAYERGNPSAPSAVVVGVIHGSEPAGLSVVRRLRRMPLPEGVHLWLVPTVNPDGLAAGTRQNAHGVDLNRNWSVGWVPNGRPWDGYYSGPRPLSEAENRAMRAFMLRVRPALTIWYHQPLAEVYGSDPHVRVLRRYARLTGLPYHRLAAPPGAATRWERKRFPRGIHFVVEFPAGSISAATARRHAAAVLALARGLRSAVSP